MRRILCSKGMFLVIVLVILRIFGLLCALLCHDVSNSPMNGSSNYRISLSKMVNNGTSTYGNIYGLPKLSIFHCEIRELVLNM